MANTGQKFTLERRAAFLAEIEAGRTQAQACKTLKVSGATIQKWLSRGRTATEGEAHDFARAYDQLKPPRRKRKARELVEEQRQGGLSVEDLVRLLEHEALNGNVPAIKYLLERPWERTDDSNETKEVESSVFDELAALRDRKTGT